MVLDTMRFVNGLEPWIRVYSYFLIGFFVTERVDESVGSAPVGGEGWLVFAHAVPGVLTSLGLLGTFVALLIGLYGLQKNLDGTWAIDPLVSNLSGKFVTSIVALALS